MKVEYINPFIESVTNTFSTMLDCDPEKNEIKIVNEMVDPKNITALIGISGAMTGTVSLGFPKATAKACVEALMGGMEIEDDDEDTLIDGISELVNIIGGSAKSKFDKDPPLELSLPNVVTGANYHVRVQSGTMCIDVQFKSKLGNFSLRVTLRDGK